MPINTNTPDYTTFHPGYTKERRQPRILFQILDPRIREDDVLITYFLLSVIPAEAGLNSIGMNLNSLWLARQI